MNHQKKFSEDSRESEEVSADDELELIRQDYNRTRKVSLAQLYKMGQKQGMISPVAKYIDWSQS